MVIELPQHEFKVLLKLMSFGTLQENLGIFKIFMLVGYTQFLLHVCAVQYWVSPLWFSAFQLWIYSYSCCLISMHVCEKVPLFALAAIST